MLPDILAGSYQRYKADTNTFTTWLSRAAITCGYKAPDRLVPAAAADTAPKAKGSRPKGKARKEAKKEEAKKASKAQETTSEPAVKYSITARDLLEQAQIVAGRVEVPGGLQKVLERAIQARQRCAEWFQTSKVDNGYSNEGHQHFIGVLEQTLELLKQQDDSAERIAERKQKETPQKKTDTSWQELANRFQKLAVEELPDVEEVDVPEDINTSATYELEEESEETKLSLMIFCFFEDTHRLQDFVHAIWEDYKSKKLDLMTASLITNSAVDIVRQSEEEIIAASPNLLSQKRSYNAIAMVIFYADALSQGQDPAAKLKSNENLRPTPFDDFIYLSTAKTLMKFEYLSTMPPPGPDSLQYPIPAMPLRASFISRPDLLGTPYMNKKEEEDANLSQLMMDLILFDDFCKVSKDRGMWKHQIPAEDELSAGLRKLKKNGTLSVSLVFASRLFLDIQDILGKEVREGMKEFKSTAQSIQATIESTGSMSDSSSSILWLSKDVKVVERLAEVMHFWALKPFFSTFKEMHVKSLDLADPNWGRLGDGPIGNGPSNKTRRARTAGSNVPQHYAHSGPNAPHEAGKSGLDALQKYDNDSAKKGNLNGVKLPEDPSFATISSTMLRVPEGYKAPTDQAGLRDMLREKLGVEDDDRPTAEHEENARNLDLKMIKPHKDPEFILSHNPVYCGILTLYLVVGSEQAGIILGNYHTVIAQVAHLYSEARRSSLLTKNWTDMDQLIEWHRDVLFAGKLPDSAGEGYIRFQKLMGLSTTSRPNRHQRGLPYKEPQCTRVPFSEAALPFLDRKAEFHSTLGHIESLIQTRRALAQQGSKHKRRNARRKLTPLELLKQIRGYLPAEMVKIKFDYIGLTKTCTTLIKKIRLDIKTELGIDHPLYDTDESVQPYYPNMTLKILGEARDVQNASRSRQEAPPQSPQMEVVARVLKKYIEAKESVSVSRMS